VKFYNRIQKATVTVSEDEIRFMAGALATVKAMEIMHYSSGKRGLFTRRGK
jgi:hypothetical protein